MLEALEKLGIMAVGDRRKAGKILLLDGGRVRKGELGQRVVIRAVG